MSAWLTYQQVEVEFGATPEDLRKLVVRGVLHVRREAGVQLFSRPDVEAQYAMRAEAAVMQQALTYTDLARVHGIKRGWLDRMVFEQRVRVEDGKYLLVDVLRELDNNPQQVVKRW